MISLKQYHGFTLIELLIVIAIMGALASMAMPAYQHYLVRARVLEGLFMAEPAKLAVAETVMTTQTFPKSQSETGYLTPEPTANVVSIKIAPKTGQIIIQYTPAAGGGTLWLVPKLTQAGDLLWSCDHGGTLASVYRPRDCRES